MICYISARSALNQLCLLSLCCKSCLTPCAATNKTPAQAGFFDTDRCSFARGSTHVTKSHIIYPV